VPSPRTHGSATFLSCWQSLYGSFNPDTEIEDTNLSNKHVQIALLSKQ
jgi:hypothetical protein